MTEKLISFLINLALAGLEVFIGFVIGPKVKQLIEKFWNKATDKGALTFVGSFVNIAIKIIAIIIALSQLGIDMNVVVGMFSAIGLGISLALQNNMANLAGGMQILLTKPFSIGDFISCESQEGTVTRIELMFTTLVTADKQEVVIPNSDLVSKPLKNYTQEPYRRLVINVAVASTFNPAGFKSEVEKIVAAQENILQEPAFSVVTSAINADSYTVTVYAFTPVALYWPTLYALNQKILEKRLEMEIPQPFSMVTMQDSETGAA